MFNLADTKRPDDVPLRPNFGGYFPDHNRTKLGRIRFVTYIGSTMSHTHFESGNIEKN